VSSHIHIGRQAELNLFRDLLHGECEERILLVGSPPGFGKTLLMIEYQRLAHQEGVPCALLDLRYVTAVFEGLATLCEEWEDCDFGQFHRQVEVLQQSPVHVDVRGVLQIGRPEIQIALTGPDEETRRSRRLLLTEALMADLRRWLRGERRAVIIIDTYNADTVPELRQWVEGMLLPHVRRSPGLLAVVAGQAVPQASLMWEDCCCRLTLQPLENPDDWMEFVELRKIPAPREVVSAFCHAHHGHPLTIATHLSALCDWEVGL
jgi:hypothetical protein